MQHLSHKTNTSRYVRKLPGTIDGLLEPENIGFNVVAEMLLSYKDWK